jgi:hypothetical protein
MKIRHQFVSNSSSTSFIVVFKKDAESCCPTCKKRNLSLSELKDLFNSSDGETTWDGEDPFKIIEDIKECYGNEKTDLIKEIEIHKALGNEIARFRISYYNDALKLIMQQCDNITVLHSDG